MNYSSITIAKRALEVAGIPVPNTEKEIREKAYEYLSDKDFLAAHSIRLGKNYTEFTRDDWKGVIEKSGESTVRNNMAAFGTCMRQGLIS